MEIEYCDFIETTKTYSIRIRAERKYYVRVKYTDKGNLKKIEIETDSLSSIYKKLEIDPPEILAILKALYEEGVLEQFLENISEGMMK